MSLQISTRGGVIHLVGDLDAQTAGALDEAIDAFVGAGQSTLTIDMSQVGFVDSTGLRSLVRARGSDREREVVLRSPSPAVLRILELTSLEDGFEVVSS